MQCEIRGVSAIGRRPRRIKRHDEHSKRQRSIHSFVTSVATIVSPHPTPRGRDRGKP